jgi:membrane-associated phospholipid phosphatase
VIDRGVRDALIWNATDTAAILSDADAYALAPTLAAGLVFAGTLDTPSWALVIDDIVPIAETVMLTHWATTGLKVAFARERPNSHIAGNREGDPFLGFPSGHTSRAFAAVTSAAMIARMRHYKSEPYIWIGGMTLAALAGYLRIAADRHYFTDTIAGAVVGVSAGLTVPLLMRRSDVSIVVTGSEVALAGHW